jgi:hypothetical protein
MHCLDNGHPYALANAVCGIVGCVQMGQDWWREVVNLFDRVMSGSLHKLWILTELPRTFVIVSAVCNSRNGARGWSRRSGGIRGRSPISPSWSNLQLYVQLSQLTKHPLKLMIRLD